MKKTFTVNLGGTVYHIDEDAYRLLDSYLTNLKIHFRNEKGADEIVKDIECRISELFSEKINSGSQVITIDDVEGVINRMGKPEDLDESRESTGKEEREQEKRGYFYREQIRHRLYRNPDDRILGGVAGGIAAYMGWDPTLVRVVLILLLFVPYFSIVLIYIIAWILIPLASTASEKLAMKGENITIENIGKTVTDGFDKISDGVGNYMKSGEPRSVLHKIGDALVQIVGVLLKVILIFTAIVLSPVLLIMAVVFIALIFAAFGILSAGSGFLLQHVSPVVDWAQVGTLPMSLLGITGVILVGIPLFSLIFWAFKSVFKWKQMGTGLKWVLVIIWIIALGGVIGTCYWINSLDPIWYLA